MQPPRGSRAPPAAPPPAAPPLARDSVRLRVKFTSDLRCCMLPSAFARELAADIGSALGIGAERVGSVTHVRPAGRRGDGWVTFDVRADPPSERTLLTVALASMIERLGHNDGPLTSGLVTKELDSRVGVERFDGADFVSLHLAPSLPPPPRAVLPSPREHIQKLLGKMPSLSSPRTSAYITEDGPSAASSKTEQAAASRRVPAAAAPLSPGTPRPRSALDASPPPSRRPDLTGEASGAAGGGKQVLLRLMWPRGTAPHAAPSNLGAPERRQLRADAASSGGGTSAGDATRGGGGREGAAAAAGLPLSQLDLAVAHAAIARTLGLGAASSSAPPDGRVHVERNIAANELVVTLRLDDGTGGGAKAYARPGAPAVASPAAKLLDTAGAADFAEALAVAVGLPPQSLALAAPPQLLGAPRDAESGAAHAPRAAQHHPVGDTPPARTMSERLWGGVGFGDGGGAAGGARLGSDHASPLHAIARATTSQYAFGVGARTHARLKRTPPLCPSPPSPSARAIILLKVHGSRFSCLQAY